MSMERYLIPSVSHACEIVRLLAVEDQGLTSAQLEGRLNLPRTTVFRLLRTLCCEQMIVKKGKCYFCGDDLTNIGLQMITSNRLHQMAIPALQILAKSSGYTAHLAVPNNGTALIVEVFDSPAQLPAASRPGLRALMHCSATGKVFLAFLYADTLDDFYAGKSLEKLTPHTITDPNILKQHLSHVVARGYALDDREYRNDVRCLAAPIRDNRGTVVAAIGVTAPISLFHKDQISCVADKVKEAARLVYQNTYQLDKVSG